MSQAIEILAKEKDLISDEITRDALALKQKKQKLKEIEDAISILGGPIVSDAKVEPQKAGRLKSVIADCLPPLGGDGLTIQQILDNLKLMGLDTAKTTIATTLTRIKKDNLAKNIDGKWFSTKSESPNNVGLSKELGEVPKTPNPIGDIFA